MNLGENWVSVDPSVDYDETLEAIEEVTDEYPGLFRETPDLPRRAHRGGPQRGKEPIVVRIFGPELTVLREKADEVNHDHGRHRRRVRTTTSTSPPTCPSSRSRSTWTRAAQVGLKPGDVRRAAATMVAGEEVGDIFRGGKAYDMVVWSIAGARDGVEAVENLMLDTPTGQRVRMADVADDHGPARPPTRSSARTAHGGSMSAPTSRGGISASVAQELEERAGRGRRSPAATTRRSWGSTRNGRRHSTAVHHRRSSHSALILLLLQASLGGWRPALLVFLTLPFALVGGVSRPG